MPQEVEGTKGLTVTSHVARDLLASAAFFKDPAAVAWEYVVNSLQYTIPGVAPTIYLAVHPRKKVIEIRDNGRGMDASGLAHFFTMHGKNPDRVAGRLGRGKFGTGKSAAFGIAKALLVDTRRNSRRNVALLSREAIDATEGEEIPVEWLMRDEPTSSADGTTVRIEDIFLDRVSAAPIIEKIERHLQAWRGKGAQVAVNDHVCEYRKPHVVESHSFRPTPQQAAMIGEVELVIEVAPAPISGREQGIVITAGAGNQVAVETCGMQTKPFGNYLFGTIDVPALETSDSPLEPYDSSRSLSLNPSHPVAATLLGFLGSKLEEVRQELVVREREKRKTEQARRLATEADRIAQILNEDYRRVMQRLREIRSAASSPGTAAAAFGDAAGGGGDEDEWVRGGAEPGTIEDTGAGRDGTGGRGRKPPTVTPRGTRDDEGTDTVDPAGGTGKKRKPRGGFRVKYDNLGEEEHRSLYDPTTLTILINLDHAVVSAALGDGAVEDPTFKRLSYEIAFSEYALALAYERTNQDPRVPADDLLYDMREDLNRISVAAASLYRE